MINKVKNGKSRMFRTVLIGGFRKSDVTEYIDSLVDEAEKILEEKDSLEKKLETEMEECARLKEELERTGKDREEVKARIDKEKEAILNNMRTLQDENDRLKDENGQLRMEKRKLKQDFLTAGEKLEMDVERYGAFGRELAAQQERQLKDMKAKMQEYLSTLDSTLESKEEQGGWDETGSLGAAGRKLTEDTEKENNITGERASAVIRRIV